MLVESLCEAFTNHFGQAHSYGPTIVIERMKFRCLFLELETATSKGTQTRPSSVRFSTSMIELISDDGTLILRRGHRLMQVICRVRSTRAWLPTIRGHLRPLCPCNAMQPTTALLCRNGGYLQIQRPNSRLCKVG